MMPVLVTDGEHRAALAAVRALGRAGYAPYICSPRRRALAGGSRFVRGEAVVADPLTDPSGNVEDVAALIEAWRIRVLLPITEASLLSLLPARARLGVEIPFPDLETFLSISDKERLLDVAAMAGIAVPRQWSVASPAEINAALELPLDFPLVLKPARSIGGAAGDDHGRIKLSVGYAVNKAALAAKLTSLPAAAYPVLLQQRVVGPGVGIFLLVWGGELLAAFAHRRLREKPPSGGVSVYSESAPLDGELLERSRTLLARFGWNGPAMVEYKVDRDTGIAYLMEVNGRFWGSLQLAIDAGVDFPTLLLAASRGEPHQPILSYRTGVRLRWWWGDVDHLLIRLRHSANSLALPPGAPGRWGVVRDFLRLRWSGERNEVLRREDPWPFVRETMDWLRRR